ncbi:helix-turn-helix domain-containing protein [Streptomyces sp. NPDC018972]|uniref:helix-turn-helix domain-containing protein n=1 Tax=Streptomyces sp. NPDC018972 TaxID=3365060 RepID=UPI0037BBBF24
MSDLAGDAWSRSPDAQEAVRPVAVSALVKGRDRVEVAALSRVSVRAVDNWWARWQAGGRGVHRVVRDPSPPVRARRRHAVGSAAARR